MFVSRHQVNLKAQHVDYNRFYIPDITSLVDIQEDYLKWFLSKAEIVSPDVVSLPFRYAESEQKRCGKFYGCGIYSACYVFVSLQAPTLSMHIGMALFWYSFMS